MTMVTLSTLLLFSLSFLLRERFQINAEIASILKKPFLPFLIWLATIILFFITVLKFRPDGHPFNFVSLTFICLPVFVSGVIAFFATKGSINNTYFTHKMTRSLYIDVNKNFIPSSATYSEQKAFIKEFIKGLPSLENITCKNIIFKSHLIKPTLARTIKRTLEDEAISFTCTPYRVGLIETATLNLWYGGKTRYRVFSHKKHANSFKVRSRGHEFIIHIHR